MTSRIPYLPRRRALGMLAALAFIGGGGPSLAFESQPVLVAIDTDAGTMIVEIDVAHAPATAANFLKHVDQGSYAGGSFYRAVTPATDRGKPPIAVIQGGRGLKPDDTVASIAHEPTSQTGLRHRDGTISMARGAPGTAATEFFICIGDQPALDAGGTRNPDSLGFAAFGRVVSGMDLVRAIQSRRADGPASDPYVEGQMLNPPVTIITARRQP